LLPYNIFIKDRLLEIRSVVADDASQWLSYLHQVGDETNFLAFTSVQVTMSVDEARQYLDHMSKRSDNLWLLAADTNRIVATLNCQRGPWPFTRRHVEFGISVLAEFWGHGLARSMIATMLEWATQNRITKINLKVRTDNTRAIQLYKSMGFTIEGRPKSEFFRPGVYYPAYHMGLKL
jgi:RimJ/RimL family protein N-acetyltransferase